MKIVNIIPGFGGSFYCGNCMRDSVFTRTLKKEGHDAVSFPIYLPMSFDNPQAKTGIPIFYGAINIYLKQNFKLFRNMPNFLEKFFNSSFLLKYASKKAGSTRAVGLEEMTISMLRGSEGNQKKELQELIAFLKNYEKPDIVHLSNALLLGIADKVKKELKIPVVCSLQDEDVWVDAMRENYKNKVWKLLGEKAKNIDAFISVSDFYANEMKAKMNIPNEKMFIIPIGIETEMYKPAGKPENPQIIGFLSRMYEEHGFGLFIDAFLKLKEKPNFKNVKLRLSGGMTAGDKKFVNKQIKKLKNKNLLNDVEFIKDFQTKDLNNFFAGLSLLSVPVLKGEAFGSYQLEALASEIPLVQPALGAFPEIIKTTKGGVIYAPNTPEVLAKKWEEVLSQPEKLKEMGKNGRKIVLEKFDTKVLTKKMIKIYETCKL